jgi:hypothetical protein
MLVDIINLSSDYIYGYFAFILRFAADFSFAGLAVPTTNNRRPLSSLRADHYL